MATKAQTLRPDPRRIVGSVEPLCARCHHNLDRYGFCQSCGATTINGRVVTR